MGKRGAITEAEWVASYDPYLMLRRCRKLIRAHPRKGHLFAVACCYRIWHLLADPRSRAAVDRAAQYAEGLAGEEQLRAAAKAAADAHADAFRAKGKVGACAEWAAEFAASSDAWFAATRASNFAYVAAGDGLQPGPEHTAQSHLLRCVFGPLPFRDVPLDPAWLAWNDGVVVKLAASIYEGRTFERMPILGDALEEAGCQDQEILAHCRGPAAHACGCWVVDLLLGRE